MASPGVAIIFIVILLYLILMAVMLILFVVNLVLRKKQKVPGIIFLCMALIAIVAWWQFTDNDDKSAKKFLGIYKLKRLDGHRCDSCEISVNENHEYLIIDNQKVIGREKWRMANMFEKDMELPYPYLKLSHGPDIKSFDTSRVIEYIDRRE